MGFIWKNITMCNEGAQHTALYKELLLPGMSNNDTRREWDVCFPSNQPDSNYSVCFLIQGVLPRILCTFLSSRWGNTSFPLCCSQRKYTSTSHKGNPPAINYPVSPCLTSLLKQLQGCPWRICAWNKALWPSSAFLYQFLGQNSAPISLNKVQLVYLSFICR